MLHLCIGLTTTERGWYSEQWLQGVLSVQVTPCQLILDTNSHTRPCMLSTCARPKSSYAFIQPSVGLQSIIYRVATNRTYRNNPLRTGRQVINGSSLAENKKRQFGVQATITFGSPKTQSISAVQTMVSGSSRCSVACENLHRSRRETSPKHGFRARLAQHARKMAAHSERSRLSRPLFSTARRKTNRSDTCWFFATRKLLAIGRKLTSVCPRSSHRREDF